MHFLAEEEFESMYGQDKEPFKAYEEDNAERFKDKANANEEQSNNRVIQSRSNDQANRNEAKKNEPNGNLKHQQLTKELREEQMSVEELNRLSTDELLSQAFELEHEWAFWYDDTRGLSKGMTTYDFENSMKTLGKFKTVQVGSHLGIAILTIRSIGFLEVL